MSTAGNLSSGGQGQSSPSLSLDDFGGQRYPNQFFDLAQQYMPPTIKELFRWCTFYFYNSPLIGSSIKKISRYPITDLIFEDEHESVRESWRKVLVDELKLKDRLMEVNLDYHVYGNAFVSIHLPFTRFLACRQCNLSQPIKQWDWQFKNDKFVGKCSRCSDHSELRVKDVPYKDRKSIRLIRWNPENIHIKFNDYTGKYTYMYSVPAKLKNAIYRGDKDVIEDVPLVVLEALRKRRMIRLNNDAIMHLKNPTLAEQDQGWGKPTIIHVLKDMYYFYTLRRAQEAIALEHIVPFDIIYPMPNAQQDPYIHTDLGNWRSEIEGIIRKHRRDPNFKAVIPVPVGFGRIGGDGKALMLSPELNYLTQTIVGGMGIPQEFLFGGLNFTGSSISLRTLENDFIQNRSQLLDLVLWIKDKIRLWMNMPDCKKIRFSDFRMADDVQRNQQLVGLNAQGKLSNNTLLTELGFDHEAETKKIIEEIYLQNYIMDLQSKGAAKSQGESQLIGWNYQQKVQQLAEKAQIDAQRRMQELYQEKSIPSNVSTPVPKGNFNQQGPWGDQQGGLNAGDPNAAEDPNQGIVDEAGAEGGQPQEGEGQPQGQERQGAEAGVIDPNAMMQVEDQVDDQLNSRVNRWASQLAMSDQNAARQTIANIKVKMPELGSQIEKAYNDRMASSAGEAAGGAMEEQESADKDGVRKAESMNRTNMDPMPTQRAATRADMV